MRELQPRDHRVGLLVEKAAQEHGSIAVAALGEQLLGVAIASLGADVRVGVLLQRGVDGERRVGIRVWLSGFGELEHLSRVQPDCVTRHRAHVPCDDRSGACRNAGKHTCSDCRDEHSSFSGHGFFAIHAPRAWWLWPSTL